MPKNSYWAVDLRLKLEDLQNENKLLRDIILNNAIIEYELRLELEAEKSKTVNGVCNMCAMHLSGDYILEPLTVKFNDEEE